MKFKLSRATPADKNAVLRLSRHFPDDYLEEVVDRWINMDTGGLFLAWHNDFLIGCCTLSFPSPAEGWLHGMRVHPDYQGQGIAFELNSYLIDRAKSKGAAVVRLLTAPDNHGALRVSAKLGLQAAGKREIIYRETLIPGKNTIFRQGASLRLCSASDLPAGTDRISSGPFQRAASGMLFLPGGYSFRSLSAAYLYQAIKNNEVYAFYHRDLLRGLVVVVRNKDERHLVIGYLDLPPEDLPSIASMLPLWAGEGYCYFSLSLFPEQHRALHPALQQWFGTYDAHQWLLMEKELLQD